MWVLSLVDLKHKKGISTDILRYSKLFYELIINITHHLTQSIVVAISHTNNLSNLNRHVYLYGTNVFQTPDAKSKVRERVACRTLLKERGKWRMIFYCFSAIMQLLLAGKKKSLRNRIIINDSIRKGFHSLLQ